MKVDITEDEAEMIISTIMKQSTAAGGIYGVADDIMENISAHAYHCYQENRLDEAERFFNFLCMYDLRNPDYFIGLWAVNQLKKKYLKACDFYALAYVMAGNNFSPLLYSGQCQLLMGNILNALQYFDIICQRCADAAVVNKAEIYVNIIRNNRSNNKKMKLMICHLRTERYKKNSFSLRIKNICRHT